MIMREYHGMKGTRLYSIWNNMKNRCRNCHVACYKDYGGRGITFCKEWNSFLSFYHWANKGADYAVLKLEERFLTKLKGGANGK